jgi:chemotaxis protein histidine kinase CheA
MPSKPDVMSSKLEQKINEFRQIFNQEFPEKLTHLFGLWKLAQHTQQLKTFKSFRFEVHSLKGSSAALHYVKLSELLGQIEQHVAK